MWLSRVALYLLGMFMLSIRMFIVLFCVSLPQKLHLPIQKIGAKYEYMFAECQASNAGIEIKNT